jgi:hypothetical protein
MAATVRALVFGRYKVQGTILNPLTRQDKTRQDKTRQDKTRQDKTRQDKTRQDKTDLAQCRSSF